jgi:hypothetical protein
VLTVKQTALIDCRSTADLGTASPGLAASFLLIVVIPILPF